MKGVEHATLDARVEPAAELAKLAIELAPLSHMLMNGFFFSQGLHIASSF